MCGIFAYTGPDATAGAIVLEGLKSLEYRGYDSWGVAIRTADGTISVIKHTGKIGSAKLPHIVSHTALGHTRWATHGGVTQANAHPHLSSDGKIVLVHNGIVENYQTLKRELQELGYAFRSETDSEVIAHLIAETRKSVSDPVACVRTAFERLIGMNGVVCYFADDDTFVAVKNGSPLVFARAGKARLLASDPAALAPHSREVLFLEDGDCIAISPDGDTYYGADGMKKQMVFQLLDFDPEDAQLNGFPHFMLKEIHEQPELIRRITEAQEEAVKKAAVMIRESYGTYLVGCGTASYAALAGTYLFSKIAGRHVNFSIASEFAYLTQFIRERSLVVPLSQSGETIDVIDGVRDAKMRKARIMTITNVQGSSLFRMADYALLLGAGPEKAVCSTKAFTAKVALLLLIAHELAGNRERGQETLKQAAAAVADVLDRKDELRALAERMHHRDHLFVLGRGVSYPVALESALKIKEVSYIHAEGFAAGELKHGVIALIEQGTPVLIYNPDDETYHDTLSAAHEVKARGAYVIGVSSRNSDVYDAYFHIDDCADATIIPNVVVAQFLGYYLAVLKGFDPDKPRNLAKSVTVK
ncbi:MAG: glutamine--fructose-6-phosphate transaminase (isomerizing) [Patescibacteria group bacterium]|nr:glutamine--fructose-6-phosphate transaminase (isomerizing) [Patescibacteria group bacterium]